jgi:hypothetical protein
MTKPDLELPCGSGGHLRAEISCVRRLFGLRASVWFRVRGLPFRDGLPHWMPQCDNKSKDKSERAPHDDMMNASAGSVKCACDRRSGSFSSSGSGSGFRVRGSGSRFGVQGSMETEPSSPGTPNLNPEPEPGTLNPEPGTSDYPEPLTAIPFRLVHLCGTCVVRRRIRRETRD